MIISFCGHSNFIQSDNDKDVVIDIIKKIAKNKPVDFYLGGYGNFDTFALSCAIKYKETHKNTKICFITPYIGKWLDKRKNVIKENFDVVIYPELEQIPQKFAILKRNEWIAKNSDYIFAYVSTHFGGAYRMLLYAHKHKKTYFNLYKGEYKLY